jgi:hypothetical protein
MPRYLRILRHCTFTSLTLALTLTASEHHGQVQYGGLPIPGVTITATQADKKLVALTDPQGVYSFPDLPDGTWSFQIEMLCFSTIHQDVTITPTAPNPVWELKLLPLTEIHAEIRQPTPAPAPSPSQATKSQSPNAKSAAPPPQPGFQRTDLNTFSAKDSVPNQPGSVNEAEPTPDDLTQRAADGFLINGTANNGASSPFGLAAAFGNNRNGPKSLYNGNLGFILDNSALDARAFSLTGQDTPKPGYNHFTAVLAFGGPIKIPHLLKNGPNFVFNYQWTRNRNATTLPALMPTLAERIGDFSQSLTPLGKPVQIFDPSGAPYSNNTIPQDRLSDQAKALLKLYPQPNFAGGARYNYQIPIVGITHQDSLQSRANKGIGRKNQIAGSFAMQSTRSNGPNIFGFLDTTDTTGINTTVNWRHSFSPRFYGNLGYQFSRLILRSLPYFANRENVSGQAGITGNNQEPQNWGPPSLSFSNGIAGLSDAQQSLTRNQTNKIAYDLIWNRGRHNISFGADFRREQYNLLSQQDPRGTFTFTGAATQSNANSGTGSALADFLLGVPDTSSIAFGNADKYFRASVYNAYITDDWRMSPGFTLNAGVRWEYGAPITELYGRLVNLDINPGFAAIAPVVGNHPIGPLTGQHFPDSLVHPDKHAIEPRIGLSWRPFAASSMVVRAGYGVYYNTSVYQSIATQMAQQSPLSKSLSVQNSPSNPLTLANGFNIAQSTPNTFAIDPHFQVGYTQTWQASVQRDLPWSTVLIATYLGIKGTRGQQEFLPNTYPVGALNPCPLCPTGFAYLTSNGNSTRESGQIQLRRRLHNGFTSTLLYTYAKAIDDSALGGKGQGGSVIAQNWLDLSAERGLSNFDQRHQLSFQSQYTPGMGMHGGTLLGGWKGALLKEWTFATQITAGTGFPLTPVYVTAVKGTGVTGSIRPDYTGAPLYAAPPGFFLNSAAYVPPAAGQWGNAGRNSITGPAQFTLNASMGRTFRLSDTLNMDLRVDATNALNHVTYPSWNTNITSAQFGLPGSANAMRNVQTSLRIRF